MFIHFLSFRFAFLRADLGWLVSWPLHNPLHQCIPTFFGSRNPYLVFKVLGGPLASWIKIRELEQFEAPLAPAHCTLVYRVTRLGSTAQQCEIPCGSKFYFKACKTGKIEIEIMYRKSCWSVLPSIVIYEKSKICAKVVKQRENVIFAFSQKFSARNGSGNNF